MEVPRTGWNSEGAVPTTMHQSTWSILGLVIMKCNVQHNPVHIYLEVNPINFRGPYSLVHAHTCPRRVKDVAVMDNPFTAQGLHSIISNLLRATCQWWARSETEVGGATSETLTLVHLARLQPSESMEPGW